jgi:hypothetical protein
MCLIECDQEEQGVPHLVRIFSNVWDPGRPALYVPAVGNADWLSNEVLAGRDLAVVWLKRGASAPTEIRSAHRGSP